MEERRVKIVLVAISVFAAVVLGLIQFRYNFADDNNSASRSPASDSSKAPELE